MAGNDIDRIIKENFVLHLMDVFKVILNIGDCEVDKESDLPSGKIQNTIEREPDFVKVMKRPNGEKFILHIEFQTTSEKDMLLRMQEYHALLQRKVTLPIRHFVIYLGKKPPKMPAKLEKAMVFEGFELRNVSEFDSKALLVSDVPEEIMMAVLGNFSGMSPVSLLKQVLGRLKEVSPNEVKLKKYIYQLTVMSRLRNLQQEIIKQTEEMGLTINIEKDTLYKKGVERGIEKGIERGVEKGVRDLAKKMKREGFDVPTISRITGLSKSAISKL